MSGAMTVRAAPLKRNACCESTTQSLACVPVTWPALLMPVAQLRNVPVTMSAYVPPVHANAWLPSRPATSPRSLMARPSLPGRPSEVTDAGADQTAALP